MNEEELEPQGDPTPEPVEEVTPAPQPTAAEIAAEVVKLTPQPVIPQVRATQAADPIKALAAQMYGEESADALRAFASDIRRQVMDEVRPHLMQTQPMVQDYARTKVTEGLPPQASEFVTEWLRETGEDPSVLANPRVAKLVRDAAELHAMKKTGAISAKPIQGSEAATAGTSYNVDAETTRSMTGMKQLYEDLGLEFKPENILRKVRA